MMIRRVLAPNPGPMTLTGTNSYLVDDGAGHLAVIDPGPDEPRHLAAILDAAQGFSPGPGPGPGPGTITTVLVTHRHGDHLPAAFPLCERTGARLAGHPDLPGVQRPVHDDEICFGPLRAVKTPGHTRESLSFWNPEDGTLFTGDLVVGTGTVVLDDQPGALAQYLASLERLLALQPTTIYPGHGPIVEDGVGKLRDYLDHRRQRVQQVVDALASRGASTIEELVAAIYTDIGPNLSAPAGRNVRANLEFLATEGKAAPVPDERWQLTP
jgi:glyoxylase-like metal-dependent hydrolase (beta-lactamase superfamily II)